MMRIWLICLIFVVFSCISTKRIDMPGLEGKVLTGSDFSQMASGYSWQERDSLSLDAFGKGSIPPFYRRFIPVKVMGTDAVGEKHKAVFFVAPDYFMIGNASDWVRVPLTPMAAQVVADRLDCFLPTKKLVDIIYEQSKVRLNPVPMFAFRDSTVTMIHHHLIIEGQRKGRKGLISGIKKDVVLCSESAMKGKFDRVAIYGWHRPDGLPIQPLYTGHVNRYVDYSHGVRLVYSMIKVDDKWMDYRNLMEDPKLRWLITDEQGRMLLRY